MARGRLVSVMALSLLAQAFCGPVVRPRRGYNDNELDSDEIARGDLMSTNTSADESFVNPAVTLPPPANTYEDKRNEFQAAEPFDDDDDDFPEMQTSSTGGGGSNIISLLNLVNGLFPASGNPNFQRIIRSMLREYLRRYPQPLLLPQNKLLRRQDFFDNEIEFYETFPLEPPSFQRQQSDDDGSEIETNGSETKDDSEESNENNGSEESKEKSDESNSSEQSKEKSDENNSSEESKEKSDENTGAEESLEGDGEKTGAEESLEVDDDNGGDASQQDEDSKPASDDNGDDSDNDGDGDNDNDSDYDDDEPPEGDGQGGGILGILAGLSGDNGESDLGSLLATISGIVVSLSGDGIDLNSLIASGIGLFVGLLSEGEENPGSILASYLLTSLETITGGGSKNNGAFFGKFLSKLISGTSAGEAPEGASDEDGEPAEGMKDSAGFIASLLMGFSGDMSKGSFAGSSKS